MLIILWFTFCYIRFRRQTEHNRIKFLEDEHLVLYHTLLERYGVKEIPAYFVDRLPNACLVGAFHPFIAIPTTISESQLPLILAHVICHQKSHDGIWGLVRNICCAMQWFNPLVWMSAHLSRIDGELACDARVTRKLQDLDRLAYANVLVSVSERKETAPCAITTSTVLTDKRLKERIGSVIRFHHIKWWAIAITSVLAIIVLIFAFSTSESSALPTVDTIPVVSWSASLTHLPDAENAIAYTRRFMESQFVGMDTNNLTFSALRTGEQWLVESSDTGSGQTFSLLFSTDGTICEYNGLTSLADLALSPCSKRRFSSSLNTYVNSFIDALIPSDSEWTGFVTADVSTDDQRIIQGELYDSLSSLTHIVVMQITPNAQVLGYRAGQTIQ